MKYEIGDIVEIITTKYKSWNDIPDHLTQGYESRNEPAPFIGQRFRVTSIRHGDCLYSNYINSMGNESLCFGIESQSVMLVRRDHLTPEEFDERTHWEHCGNEWQFFIDGKIVFHDESREKIEMNVGILRLLTTKPN